MRWNLSLLGLLVALTSLCLSAAQPIVRGHLVINRDGTVYAEVSFYTTYAAYQSTQEKLEVHLTPRLLKFNFTRTALYSFNVTGEARGKITIEEKKITLHYLGTYSAEGEKVVYEGLAVVDLGSRSAKAAVRVEAERVSTRAKLISTAKEALYKWSKFLGEKASYTSLENEVRFSAEIPEQYLADFTTTVFGVLPLPTVFSIPHEVRATALVNFASKNGSGELFFEVLQEENRRIEKIWGVFKGEIAELYAPVGFASGLLQVLPLEALMYLKNLNGTLTYAPSQELMVMSIKYRALYKFNVTRTGNYSVLWGTWHALPKGSYTFECKGVYCLSDSGEFTTVGYILPKNTPVIVVSNASEHLSSEETPVEHTVYEKSSGQLVIAVPAAVAAAVSLVILASSKRKKEKLIEIEHREES